MLGMAKTKRDMQIKARIQQIIKELKDTPEKDLIYTIAGQCGISRRTASEHYHAIKAQKLLEESGFKNICTHKWNNYFCTPAGLCRECLMCGKTEFNNDLESNQS